MRISNRITALEWLHAWSGALREGILNSAIEAMRACYGSAFQAGLEIEATGYAEAFSVLSAGRITTPLHEGIKNAR